MELHQVENIKEGCDFLIEKLNQVINIESGPIIRFYVLAMKNKGNPMVQVEAAHLFQDFVERCGASICKDLRGIGKEKPLCSCEDCIKEAIALLY